MNPARFAVNQVVLVNLLFAVIMLAGVLVARRIPVDVFPDISFNSAVVTTLWQGASPDEVERLVTTKLEDEIRDVVGIKEWNSFSSQGLSTIFIEWDEALSESEQQAALNDLRASIERVQDLPEDAEESVLTELSVSEVYEICMVAVSDVGGVGERALREAARRIEREVERVPGVRKAKLMAARDRELRVYVDRDRALQFDLTLAEIAGVIGRNNQNVPAGTFSDETRQEITVRGLGNFVSSSALAATVVKQGMDGRPVRLGDVAEVVEDFERRRYYGYFNGHPTIMVGVSKTSGADISEVIERVRGVVATEAPGLPEGMQAELVWDSSIFVHKRISILRDNLVVGVALVVLILWLTIGFRNSLLAIVGVPFSFLAALILFPLFGITINMLSLVGFVMVSGMLVDDAIIVIENIYRHIEEGEPLREAIVNGTEEVLWPVIAAVATTTAAFIPMLLVTGTSGEFMSILPKTVIACLLASLFECLLILPAHYLDWGTPERPGREKASHRLRARVDTVLDGVRNRYLALLDPVLAHRGVFLLVCGAAFYFSCGLSQHVPVDLFPGDFNQLFVTVEAPTDYGVDQTNEVVLGVQAALEPIRHELDEISTYVGQGMTADERPIFASNYGVLFISFPDSRENVADPARVLRMVRERLEEYRGQGAPGLVGLIISPPRNGPPIGKPVAVRIMSDDYDLAKQIAGEMKGELAGMPGVFNIEDNVPVGQRELRLGLDEYRASLHGLSFQDLGVALRAANDGLVPSSFKDPLSDEDVDIRVMLRADQRASVADLVDVDLRTPTGSLVKLGDVGEISLQRGYQRLYHFDARRAVVVYADVDNRVTSSVQVNRALQVRFEDTPRKHPGVSLVFGGEYEATNEAFADMRRAFVIALLAIYTILAAQFRSYLQPLVVMSVIVFAYIGVVVGMIVFGHALSMYVIYAMVGLAGIVVNDSLVLIDFVNRERARGTPAPEAVRLAGALRFRPVLLTSLTTIAGLLPMALGVSGVSPVFGPFAAAIVAGLAVATVLTLFVVPSLYLGLEALRERVGLRAHP